jgi:formyl-CoA transferase
MATRKTTKSTTKGKAAAKKATAKRTKKAVAASARKASARKAPARKTAAKKTPARKAPARKTPARKAATKKPAARKTAARRAAKKTAAKKPARRSTAKRVATGIAGAAVAGGLAALASNARVAARRLIGGNGAGSHGLLPEPSTRPFGEAGKALQGIKILDFTHVQSGPTCTQLLGYMGADVIKVERPGVGDITRTQLRDVKGADSLYFTMLNGNKRSITIDSKNAKGKEILQRLI